MATVNWGSGYNKTITIASGQTVSADVLNLAGLGARRKFSVQFYAPGTLPETITVQVAPSPTGTFAPLQSGGSDVTLTAGDATTVVDLVAGALRLVAGGAVGGDRVFTLMGNVE